jgi:carotenoid cleavage dioxygenase-like enzyme
MDFSKGTHSILQYNHETAEFNSWEEAGVLMSEPMIVPNPEGTEELDALIMVSVYDNNIEANRLVMIDCKTMEAVSDTKLPFKLSMTLHQGWFQDIAQ